jgi:hypothetical protein
VILRADSEGVLELLARAQSTVTFQCAQQSQCLLVILLSPT